MNQNPIIKALRKELAKERDDLQNLFIQFDGDRKVEFIAKYPVLWNEVYDIMEESRYHRAMINSMIVGHEAASARLLTIIEKAVEMANFYAPSNSYDYDKTQGVNYIWNDQGKKAREFLTTLADASGESGKEGE